MTYGHLVLYQVDVDVQYTKLTPGTKSTLMSDVSIPAAYRALIPHTSSASYAVGTTNVAIGPWRSTAVGAAVKLPRVAAYIRITLAV
jgi:hypothetical protein